MPSKRSADAGNATQAPTQATQAAAPTQAPAQPTTQATVHPSPTRKVNFDAEDLPKFDAEDVAPSPTREEAKAAMDLEAKTSKAANAAAVDAAVAAAAANAAVAAAAANAAVAVATQQPTRLAGVRRPMRAFVSGEEVLAQSQQERARGSQSAPSLAATYGPPNNHIFAACMAALQAQKKSETPLETETGYFVIHDYHLRNISGILTLEMYISVVTDESFDGPVNVILTDVPIGIVKQEWGARISASTVFQATFSRHPTELAYNADLGSAYANGLTMIPVQDEHNNDWVVYPADKDTTPAFLAPATSFLTYFHGATAATACHKRPVDLATQLRGVHQFVKVAHKEPREHWGFGKLSFLYTLRLASDTSTNPAEVAYWWRAPAKFQKDRDPTPEGFLMSDVYLVYQVFKGTSRVEIKALPACQFGQVKAFFSP